MALTIALKTSCVMSGAGTKLAAGAAHSSVVTDLGAAKLPTGLRIYTRINVSGFVSAPANPDPKFMVQWWPQQSGTATNLPAKYECPTFFHRITGNKQHSWMDALPMEQVGRWGRAVITNLTDASLKSSATLTVRLEWVTETS